MSNYLDDFLFAVLTRLICNHMVQAFLDICKEINCPVSDEKTMWATEIIVFLGILLDGQYKLLALSEEKCRKAKNMLQWLIGKKICNSKGIAETNWKFELFDQGHFCGKSIHKKNVCKMQWYKTEELSSCPFGQ